MLPTLSPDRAAFRQTVAEVAAKAKAKLPQAVNGRVESAVTLVLAGDVQPQPDGTVVVYSATDATRRYVLQGATCTCTDFAQGKAPDGWCKHRVAAGIEKRVRELLLLPADPAPALPEAPASINFKVGLGGIEAQVTIRGTSEVEVLQRAQRLIKEHHLQPPPKPAPRSGNWRGRNQGR